MCKTRIPMDNLTMYMITHKNIDFTPSGRIPIFVGTGENKRGYITDSTGINIAQKNPYYCELTALYWIWKNDKTSDYVSIEHYRRFFMDNIFPKIISKEKVLSILHSNRIICAENEVCHGTVRKNYEVAHVKRDMQIVEEAIQTIFPEYTEDFYQILNGKKLSLHNMIICSKKMFDAYCEWLFTILEYVEGSIDDIEQRDSYQKRVYGFLAERLMCVWLNHERHDTIRLPIRFLPNSAVRSVLHWLEKIIGNCM